MDLDAKNDVEESREAGSQGGMGRKKPMDMTAWYNWTTFDVIGDLAFGEPFGCLERAQYDPWVAAVTSIVRAMSIVIALKYLGLEALIKPLLKMARGRNDHMKKTRDKLTRRMEMGVERPDLIEGLLKNKENWVSAFSTPFEATLLMLITETRASISTNYKTTPLILAGSETTETLLSGVTYLLLKSPESLKKLTTEIRSSFKSADEITLSSVGKLGSLLACLDEALRCYPPLPMGVPRVIPEGGSTVAGEFAREGEKISIHLQFPGWHSTLQRADL